MSVCVCGLFCEWRCSGGPFWNTEVTCGWTPTGQVAHARVGVGGEYHGFAIITLFLKVMYGVTLVKITSSDTTADRRLIDPNPAHPSFIPLGFFVLSESTRSLDLCL